MSCMPDDLVEGAVREVARVYELIKTHQPLFLHHHHHPQPAITTQMTQSLLGEALRALNIAISVMKQQQQQEIGNGTTASPDAVQLSSPSEPANSKEAMTSTSVRSGKRRRPVTEGGNKNSSWTILTRVPYEDGYGWRKYGEKRINGTHFTKSYFRCTHKEDTGCLATKYVQQKDNSDPPVFQVTYNNEHTCNHSAALSSSAKKTNSNPQTTSNNPPTGGHHDAMMIKQEATVVLQTPLADVVSVVPLDDHQMLPYQEPFPIADYYVTMNAGDSSCLLGAFCNELDMGQIITEPLIGEDDLELFFLCNGF